MACLDARRSFPEIDIPILTEKAPTSLSRCGFAVPQCSTEPPSGSSGEAQPGFRGRGFDSHVQDASVYACREIRASSVDIVRGPLDHWPRGSSPKTERCGAASICGPSCQSLFDLPARHSERFQRIVKQVNRRAALARKVAGLLLRRTLRKLGPNFGRGSKTRYEGIIRSSRNNHRRCL